MENIKFLAMVGGGFLAAIFVVYILSRVAVAAAMRSINQCKQNPTKLRSDPNG